MLENVRLSFQGIWSHKMRSFLTMLGIIIGIASIISIVSTIKGTNEQIKQNLIGAGNNNVTVSLKQGDGDYWMDNGLPSGVSKLSDETHPGRVSALRYRRGGQLCGSSRNRSPQSRVPDRVETVR